MTVTPAVSPVASPPSSSVGGRLRRAWAFSPLLTLSVVANLALIPLFIVAAIADPRIITGAPAWIKPLKFAISIALYSATLIWLLTFVDGRTGLVKIIAGITGFGLRLEMALISLQVLRGTASHFNVAAPIDAAIFSIMGAAITVVALLVLAMIALLTLQRLPDPAFSWSLRLGLLVTFAGMVVAFLMTSPTAAQMEAAQNGAQMTVAGAHSVGVDDGGPGLPLLGWSTEAGDLRVPHFFGLHAMQILPLAGALLAARSTRRRLATGQRVALVWTAGVGYLGLVLLATWQALRGQSLIAPDALTLTALTALAVGMALAALTAVLVPRRLARS